jgi:hypothetical protein
LRLEIRASPPTLRIDKGGEGGNYVPVNRVLVDIVEFLYKL